MLILGIKGSLSASKSANSQPEIGGFAGGDKISGF
jgi:hypothetical protein